MSAARVAAIGALGAELHGALERFETPTLALEAGVDLLVMLEDDWARHQLEAPRHAVCAVITRSARRDVCGQYLLDPRVRHVIFRGDSFREELRQTLTIARGEAPLATRSLGWCDASVELRLTSSDGQAAVLEQAKAFASDSNARGRASANWLDALSESLSNALYNAPRSGGRAPYLGLHRGQTVDLGTANPVSIRLFSSEDQLAFAVIDPFGSLTPLHFQKFMGGALAADGHAQAVDKPGGAGLGLMMMFDRLDRVVAMVEPGRQTCVVGVGPLSYGGRGRARGHTVQFFEAQP